MIRVILNINEKISPEICNQTKLILQTYITIDKGTNPNLKNTCK